MKGFTLVEVLIVIGIAGALVALTIPLGIGFYNSQQLDTTTEEIVQALRRAQLKAMSMQDDSAWGVYFEIGQYRLEDETFVLNSNIEITGTNQVIFSKLEGLPSYTGNINISNDKETQTITINAQGVVSY